MPVDARGVPLSVIVTGANVHDARGLGAALNGCVIKRPLPEQGRSRYLWAEAGCCGKPAMKVMFASGCIPQVVGRATVGARRSGATPRAKPGAGSLR